MATIKLNTHFGTLNIYKRVKGTYQLNIFFKDIGKDNHYRASLGTNQKSLAEPKARQMTKRIRTKVDGNQTPKKHDTT